MFYNYYHAFPDIRRPEIFSDDFLTNTVIQLPSVRKVSIKAEYFQYNNATLRCLFHLLSNLINLETFDMKRARKYLESRGHYYDDFVKNTLNRIELKSPNNWIDLEDNDEDKYCKPYFEDREY